MLAARRCRRWATTSQLLVGLAITWANVCGRQSLHGTETPGERGFQPQELPDRHFLQLLVDGGLDALRWNELALPPVMPRSSRMLLSEDAGATAVPCSNADGVAGTSNVPDSSTT